MSVWAFASVKSSPGVTTTVLAAATVWPTPVLVAELGVDGGVLAARHEEVAVDTGLLSLSVALRSGPVNVAAHTQGLAGTDDHVRVLAGPPGAESAVAVQRSIGTRLGDCLAGAGRDVLIDAGRLGVDGVPTPLAEAADGLVVVARPIVEDLAAVKSRWDVISSWHRNVAVLLVGTDPYGPDDVAANIGCRVLGAVAHDPKAAEALAGQTSLRHLRRSGLLRSAAGIVGHFAAPVATSTSESPPSAATDTGEEVSTHA